MSMGTYPICDLETKGDSKMKMRFWVLFSVLGLSVLLSGCSSAPTAEITATTDALKSIETPDVTTYAPESLKAAQEELNKALAEVKVQDEKFALTRDYKPSLAALKSTKDLVEKAQKEAQSNKAKAKADAELAVADLPIKISEAYDLLAKAPKGKDTKADLEAMQNDMKLAEAAAAEANSALIAEKYIDALAKANMAKEKSSSVIEQVQNARMKLGRKG
jgi:competence protein ComGC